MNYYIHLYEKYNKRLWRKSKDNLTTMLNKNLEKFHQLLVDS